MSREQRLQLVPALVVATGIVASTAVVVFSGGSSEWLGIAGLLLLALAIVQADALRARLQGRPARPSIGASLVGCSFAVAGMILMPISADDMATLVPVFAMASWMVLFPSTRDGQCGTRTQAP
jgi:hypothetical protein